MVEAVYILFIAVFDSCPYIVLILLYPQWMIYCTFPGVQDAGSGIMRDVCHSYPPLFIADAFYEGGFTTLSRCNALSGNHLLAGFAISMCASQKASCCCINNPSVKYLTVLEMAMQRLVSETDLRQSGGYWVKLWLNSQETLPQHAQVGIYGAYDSC
jgi:hypothetical protein